MKTSYVDKKEVALFVYELVNRSKLSSALTITIEPRKFADFYAIIVTDTSLDDTEKTKPSGTKEQPSTSDKVPDSSSLPLGVDDAPAREEAD